MREKHLNNIRSDKNAASGLKFKFLGENVTWFPSTIFINSESISILDNSQIADYCLINGGKETLIGNNVHISSFTSIVGGGELFLDSFAGLSAGCRIISGTDDFSGESLTNPTVPAEFKKVTKGKIEIGRHALLGSNVVVLPNVRIGEGAIVSAGSVVNKDLEDWSIYAGYNPKKVATRDKHKVLSLELQYYNKYFKGNMLDRYKDRIKQIKEIIKG